VTAKRKQVPKPAKAKPEVIVTVNIRPGPASELQKRQWSKFWQRILSQTKKEVAADGQ